jgi:hypothetical protein
MPEFDMNLWNLQTWHLATSGCRGQFCLMQTDVQRNTLAKERGMPCCCLHCQRSEPLLNEQHI